MRSQTAADLLRTCLAGMVQVAITGDLELDCAGSADLGPIDALIHLAGRAHRLQEVGTAHEILARYRRANGEVTARAIRLARRFGCRRAIYVSSAKVHGDFSLQPFTEADSLQPNGPYALSKAEAEIIAQRTAGENGMECVIVRPPLIYGPGVKANLLNLLKLVNSGMPIPVPAEENSRSLISVANFASALIRCSSHADAAGRIFLVSDCGDISTAQLVRYLAEGLHRRPRLVAVPGGLLKCICRVTGQMRVHERLFSSLQVNSGGIIRILGWCPVETASQGLRNMTDWYLRTCNSAGKAS